MINELKSPYSEILPMLVSSVMRAQASILEALFSGILIQDVDDRLINRHFSWLSLYRKPGFDRHIFGGTLDETITSLLNLRLTRTKSFPIELREAFLHGKSIDQADIDTMLEYVRQEPTRISRILKNEFTGWDVIEVVHNKKSQKLTKKYAVIPSPLLICTKILTVPDTPSSSSFSFLALRNYLIEALNAGSDRKFSDFNEADLIASFKAIKTSFDPRFRSSGQDKLENTSRAPFASFLREFFCLTGLFNYRFDDPEKCIEFLKGGSITAQNAFDERSKLYEFSRRPHLNKLPEIGDLANQIWGLPLPIRGAEVVFRGGIKFPDRQGIVMAVHGGPGSGKTSFALGIGAALAGFGIKTLYFSAEEQPEDLKARAATLVPSAYRGLSFYPKRTEMWLDILGFSLSPQHNPAETALERLGSYFDILKDKLDESSSNSNNRSVISPCRQVVVLDGLHDLISRAEQSASRGNGSEKKLSDLRTEFHLFIEKCKSLKALVILTAGTSWAFGHELDYLVDTAMHLSHDTGPQDGGKPERLLNLSKTRHQSCSAGTHGFQISGEKGVRITPQTNFCLDLDSIWSFRLPDETCEKHCLTRVASISRLPANVPAATDFKLVKGIKLFRSSNIFLNGQGSGGKAGMALKIASAPYFDAQSQKMSARTEKILIISFLYPVDYYEKVHQQILRVQEIEHQPGLLPKNHSRFDVIHFYPGFLRPASLFSRVEWQIKQSELMGDPYTTVIIDGLHNVFIQFPELEKRQIIWPQLFSMLRRRDVTIITTHTVLTVSVNDNKGLRGSINVDDYRSDPLRHALVQKTDFSFEIDPIPHRKSDEGMSAEYEVTALSAIAQPLPDSNFHLLWHRERMYFYTRAPDGQLRMDLE
jgi:KaiC/GvpD/RAD55 family RecA-like ATPase